MINPLHLRDEVIRPILKSLDPVLPGALNPTAVNLLCGIAAVESTIGDQTYLKQQRGPALGIFQIEPRTRASQRANYIRYRPDLLAFIDGLLPASQSPDRYRIALISDLRYQAAIARIKIYRGRFDWCAPDDIEGQARIWKNIYNTRHGKGTIQKFVDAYPTIILRQ